MHCLACLVWGQVNWCYLSENVIINIISSGPDVGEVRAARRQVVPAPAAAASAPDACASARQVPRAARRRARRQEAPLHRRPQAD